MVDLHELTNICIDCGYTWYPRTGASDYIVGKALAKIRRYQEIAGITTSGNCPKCNSEAVFIISDPKRNDISF